MQSWIDIFILIHIFMMAGSSITLYGILYGEKQIQQINKNNGLSPVSFS